jgi:hypothetical protein
VESQNWNFTMTAPKRKSRGADSTSYVFCSKELPATIDEVERGRFMLDFLTPNDDGAYGHANEMQLAIYFAVCHGRTFDSMLNGAAEFARTLGYKVSPRDDRPTVDRPEKVLNFLASAGPKSTVVSQQEWAKLAEECSGGHGDDPATLVACDQANVVWNVLTASGCEYKARAHSFDPNGWVCRHPEDIK